MMLIPCKIVHPESRKTVDAVFDADTGFAYIDNGASTIIMAGGVTFQVAHALEAWSELLQDEIWRTEGTKD